jgi:3',5'-cyclic AMP phosphodiesterase CpdA
VPGEHDIYDGGALYRERFGKNTMGTGWYSFDQKGIHFIGLVNVAKIQEGGLGTLGQEQLDWLEKDVKSLSPSTPIVLFAHIPLWAVYPQWGWGTDDAERALSFVKRFGSVTVLNGHIHQVMQKVEGNITFHTARGTAFPLPTPGFSAQTASGSRRSPSTQEDARTNQRELHRNEPYPGRGHGQDADGGEDAPSLLKLQISGAHMALVIQSGIKD